MSLHSSASTQILTLTSNSFHSILPLAQNAYLAKCSMMPASSRGLNLTIHIHYLKQQTLHYGHWIGMYSKIMVCIQKCIPCWLVKSSSIFCDGIFLHCFRKNGSKNTHFWPKLYKSCLLSYDAFLHPTSHPRDHTPPISNHMLSLYILHTSMVGYSTLYNLCFI